MTPNLAKIQINQIKLGEINESGKARIGLTLREFMINFGKFINFG